MNKTLYIDNFTFWTENDTEKLPDVSFIPAMLRRRMNAVEKIAIALAARVAPESADYTVVFASRFGEWNQTIKLVRQFYEDKEMSPAGFSNSVHNAAMGHLSLLTHNKNSYTSIAGGHKTIETALLTALVSDKPVLFVYAEEKNPEEYNHLFKKPVASHGCALFIDKSGKNAYELAPNNQDLPALSFEKLQESMQNNTEIQTSNWKLTKK
ncbi:MAG: beta-ketoacyl synthase chain length factor [Alphaproteobacteria bacterium]|nr:beta-ketoacyl synthase chain length factor [Alphaproteobacteria bacterium]